MLQGTEKTVKSSIESKTNPKASWIRYLVSRLILVLFGVFLLIFTEGALRIADFPEVDSFTVRTSIDPFREEEGWVQTRDSYLQVMRKNRFMAEKPTGITRIFCLGG